MAEMFGKFEVFEKLGEGGQGTVFRAMDRDLGRMVAIKKSHRTASADPAYASAFQRAARTAAGLNHTNIVTVYETGIEDDIPYIVMEFVPEVLSSILESGKSLPLKRVVTIGTEICRGLEYAHRRGVVHRDIKAQNILLNDEAVAKITDYCIEFW